MGKLRNVGSNFIRSDKFIYSLLRAGVASQVASWVDLFTGFALFAWVWSCTMAFHGHRRDPWRRDQLRDQLPLHLPCAELLVESRDRQIRHGVGRQSASELLRHTRPLLATQPLAVA